MSEISETQSKLDELMNEYEVAVIGENRGRNRSGYSEKADKYYQKRRELKEFVAKIEGEHHWIPVTEPPTKSGKYNVLIEWESGKVVDTANYLAKATKLGNQWVNDEYIGSAYFVTHWMPLPQLPEVQE